MSQDVRAQFKAWLESGEARLQPVTLPQRELWENSPVPVADPANHICGLIEVRGPITPEQCEVALQRVIERQEALRITFIPGKERPLQMVRASGTAVLGVSDLRAGEDLEEKMLETYRQPFDLLQGPLYRLQMIRRGPNDLVLAFSFHHAIADGWSLGVFVQDLCTAYVMGLTGLRKAVAVGMMGLKNSLPPVGANLHRVGRRRARGVATRRNRQTHGFLEIPPRRIQQDLERCGPPEPLQRWVSAIPADLVRGVKSLAVSHSTTIFSTLLAAFQLTLSKWTGKDDILVGTPVANRNKEAVRETMGYFAGVVPLRGQVDRTQNFSDHLRAVSESALDSFANAIPFAELAAAVAGPHGAGSTRFSTCVSPCKTTRCRTSCCHGCPPSCGCARPAPRASTSPVNSRKSATS